MIRAAQYLRASTERQHYSAIHQASAIAIYATSRGYEIVKTYADQGVSGTLFKERHALRQLLAEVLSGSAPYSVVLVYDVSRWGRFQDPDQSAHYEFICRQAGVGVRYCAEPFDNDGSPTGALLKQVKRLMAAEYSRELSVKVSAAQRGLAAEGFRQGGPPGFGLRRQVIDEAGRPVGSLAAGEHKTSQSHRVVLTPGPDADLKIIRRIVRLYLDERLTQKAIVARLNSEGVTATGGLPWSRYKVRQILTNEKYAGDLVYGRKKHPLGLALRDQPSESWVRVKDAYEAVVGRRRFAAARRRALSRGASLSNEDMLARLGAVLKRAGALSVRIIREADMSPRAATYARRFGSLQRTYELVGFRTFDAQTLGGFKKANPRLSDREMLEHLRRLLAEQGALSFAQLLADKSSPSPTAYRNRFGGLRQAYQLIGYTEQPAGRKSRAAR